MIRSSGRTARDLWSRYLPAFVLSTYLSTSASALPIVCARYIVPTVASAHGKAGTYFRSDLWIANQSTERLTFFLDYRCSVACPPWQGGSPQVTLEPGETRQFDDVVRTIFNRPESRGALSVGHCIVLPSPDSPFSVISRTYTDAPGGSGTNGTVVPGFGEGWRILSASFIGLAANAGDLRTGYRTNVGIVGMYSVPDHPISVRLTLRDSTGALIGAGTVSVGDPVQINDVFAALGAPDVVTTNATLHVESSDGYFIPWVTVIDNQSGDSNFLPITPRQ